MDMEVLCLVPGLRGQPLAKLTSDRRKHTEKVQDFYDKHEQLPVDYRNTEFWIPATPSTPSSSGIMSNYLVKKPSSTELLGPPAKKAAVESVAKDPHPQLQEDPDDDLPVDEAEDALQRYAGQVYTAVESENIQEDQAQTVVTEDKGNIKEIVKSALVEALKDPEAAKLLSEQIVYRIKKLSKDDTEEIIIDESVWMSGDDFISCIPCLKYSDMEKVPAALRKYKKGNFGRIKAKGEGFHIRHSQKEHEASDLHKWCAVKSEELEKEKIVQDTKNKQAAENTVRNVIFALKNGGGSELFLSLMDKDNLTEGIEALAKNDSKCTFFDVREIVYEEVDKRVKYQFRNIKCITVTLDMVTVGHISYMVILTYFFQDGQINIFLNRLEKLQDIDYNGPGTADIGKGS